MKNDPSKSGLLASDRVQYLEGDLQRLAAGLDAAARIRLAARFLRWSRQLRHSVLLEVPPHRLEEFVNSINLETNAFSDAWILTPLFDGSSPQCFMRDPVSN